MADENEKQKEPDYKMSPDTEAGLKKALGAGGVLGDSADALFGGIKSAAESTGRVEQIKQKQAEALAGGELNASRAFADTAAKQFEAMKAARGEMPKRDIEEHTMQGLIGLGALLPMAGAMLGNKGLASGTGAMQAMAGLFNGYREGNKERIAFEQKRYDDQMKQWETHARQLESDFRNAIEISKTNLQAGHDAAKLAAVKAGAPMIAAMVDQQGALKTLEVIEKTVSQTMAYDNAIKKAQMLQGIKTEAAGSRDAYGFNEIVTTAANEASASIKNIVNMNPDVSTGLFGGRQSTNPFTAPLDAMTNAITSEDVQRYNVEIANFGKFIAQLQKGGRAVTNYDIAQASQQFAIRMGDSPLTVLTKLAQMRQSAERAIDVRLASPKTPEGLKEILRQNKEEITDSIPFTVNDVNSFANKQKGNQTFTDYIKDFQGQSSQSSNSDGSINVGNGITMKRID
jgi:hypothetical protein